MPPSRFNHSAPSSSRDSSHLGCTTCKARKKKCPTIFDETGGCTECRRLGIVCLRHFPDWMKDPTELQAYRKSIGKDIAFRRKLSRLPPASQSRALIPSMCDADIHMSGRRCENDSEAVSGYGMGTLFNTEQFESSHLECPASSMGVTSAAGDLAPLQTPPAPSPLGPNTYVMIGDSSITADGQDFFSSLIHPVSDPSSHQTTAATVSPLSAMTSGRFGKNWGRLP